MSDATVAKAAEATRERGRDRYQFRWVTVANGRVYRPAMRLMHRLGWCYPERVNVEPGYVWCHWCGMRGHAPAAPPVLPAPPPGEEQP